MSRSKNISMTLVSFKNGTITEISVSCLDDISRGILRATFATESLKKTNLIQGYCHDIPAVGATSIPICNEAKSILEFKHGT